MTKKVKYENKILRKRLLSLPVAKSCLQFFVCVSCFMALD